MATASRSASGRSQTRCWSSGRARSTPLCSGGTFEVPQGSLYPALQRLLLNDYVRAEWGASENNRRARYYTLTPAGRRHLQAETQEFSRLIGAIQHVLETA